MIWLQIFTELRVYLTKEKETAILLNKLKDSNPTSLENIKAKEETLSTAEKLLNNKQEVINAFKTGIFPYIDGFQTKKESEEESDEKLDENKFFKYIENQSKSIDYDLFETHFNVIAPTVLAKTLFETKNKKNNNDLVNVSNSELKDLKEEITNISEEGKKIEKPNDITKIFAEILEFSKKIRSGKGLKILTPNQILSRLPIALAQLKIGNNSVKLGNEIRHLFYYLYRSEKPTKHLYKSLIDTI